MTTGEEQARSETLQPETDPRESNPNSAGPQGLAGDMGVSSERLGPAGPGGTLATDGTRPTSPPPLPDEDPVPEQQPGSPEENPVGLPPKAHDPTKNPGHSHG